MIIKNKWKPILTEMGFSEEKHEVLLNYIQRCITNEIELNNYVQKTIKDDEKFNFPTNKKLFFTEEYETVKYALKVFTELDFNRLRFVNAPISVFNNKTYQTALQSITYDITSNTPIMENNKTKIMNFFIEKTTKILNEIMKTQYLYIYMLFANTIIYNKKVLTTHRYFTSNNDLKK